jgi:hypothetical protein
MAAESFRGRVGTFEEDTMQTKTVWLVTGLLLLSGGAYAQWRRVARSRLAAESEVGKPDIRDEPLL